MYSHPKPRTVSYNNKANELNPKLSPFSDKTQFKYTDMNIKKISIVNFLSPGDFCFNHILRTG